MNLLVHDGDKVVRILSSKNTEVLPEHYGMDVVAGLQQLAQLEPDSWILWCDQRYQNQFNWTGWKRVFRHQKIMASYSPGGCYYLTPGIGYVENTPFITVKQNVTYPTWMMSGDVGGVHAQVLQRFIKQLPKTRSIEFFLNSMGKIGLPLGLYCYSNPQLLNQTPKSLDRSNASTTSIFRFVRQHYKKHWVWVLFACLLVYEKRLPILALLRSLGHRQHQFHEDFLDDIAIINQDSSWSKDGYDVVIPTMGRKAPLHQFLKDLAAQTRLPNRVIIVEQNPDSDAESDLDYLKTESWPFEINHQFIHQTGACNARNLALAEVESPWTFLGDDDIRIAPDLMERLLSSAQQIGVGALVSCCLQPHEKQTYFKTRQTGIFGSGTSLVRSDEIKKVAFDTGFEFGYGEDSDFGMQLRNNGVDVAYCAETVISHLKAPIGGFRTQFEHPWAQDPVPPKPSPTIMLYHIKHNSQQQLNGYQLSYFLRFYRRQKIKNPFRYLSTMKKSWKRSQFWATQLMKQSESHA